ncbi:hypothetical protein MMC20_003112 [Loxospora ochrophaea]|nr:hypothetical protein [Loxospora ochrophaea]
MSTRVPTYAILGGTGATGSQLIAYLLSRPSSSVNLHIYARSLPRLTAQFPILPSAPNVTLFTGPVSDAQNLASCLCSTTAIFCTVAQNSNNPDTSVSITTAHAVVSALEILRAESPSPASYTSPPLIWPGSSSLVKEWETNGRTPRFVYPVIHSAMFYVYQDLEFALEYLKGQEWIPVGIWAPGALVNDEPRGIELTLTDGGGNISYADLARAMVAMVEDGDAEKKWTGRGKEMKHVGMVPLGGKAVAGFVGLLRAGAVEDGE